MRCAQKVLVAKPEGRRPQGRPKLRLMDNIKCDNRELDLKDVDCIAFLRIRTGGGLLRPQ